MSNHQRYSCTSELGAEVLVLITSYTIVCTVYALFVSEIFHGVTSREANILLSSAYALFLPLMSYMFSQAKQYKPEGRAQLILIWMVLIEIVRIRGDHISSLVGNYENQQSNWLQDHSQTTPMSSCDYIVMGEENLEVTVCDKGDDLGFPVHLRGYLALSEQS
jgi:hypothetical protein